MFEARLPRQALLRTCSAKAAQANFDIATLWYHGTRRRFDGFRLPKEQGIDELGPGVYLTGKQWLANTWARKGGFIVICVIRQGPTFDLADLQQPETQAILKHGYRQAANARWGKTFAMPDAELDDTFAYQWRDGRNRPGLINQCLAGAGYVGAYKQDSQIQGQIVVFKPEDVMIVARRGGENYMTSFD